MSIRMLGVFALATTTFAAQFPIEPIKVEFDRGFALARRVRKPGISDLFRTNQPRSDLSLVFQSDKREIGWWSNGYEHKPIESVVWLSPRLLSRWIGFLAAQEYWSEEETESRWEKVVVTMASRRAFVVQLSAFPKQPTYGIGDEERPSAGEIDEVRFVYTAGKEALDMNAIQLARWQSRNRFDLDGCTWWRLLPFSQAVTGEFDPVPTAEPIALGDFQRSWTFVWIEGADDPKFEVRVLSRRKERVARFSDR